MIGEKGDAEDGVLGGKWNTGERDDRKKRKELGRQENGANLKVVT